ncbi:hypothetical protein O9929_26275 [Vibrio lentus]|nr:hypothetical protein [Vibrio lentus]
MLRVTLGSTGAFKEEKHPDDPTKIVTKAFGVAYNEDLQFSGSIGLDEANDQYFINADGEEWRLAVHGCCFGYRQISTLVALNTTTMLIRIIGESIGTFVPPSYFDIEPFGWQISPYGWLQLCNDGEVACSMMITLALTHYVSLRRVQHTVAYWCVWFKTITDEWSIMGLQVISLMITPAINMSVRYKLSDAQSFNFFTIFKEDDFGEK